MATVSVRYIGKKDWEADQWLNTGTTWNFSGHVADMEKEAGNKMVLMLPGEFEIALPVEPAEPVLPVEKLKK
jgi:hypothetical protein